MVINAGLNHNIQIGNDNTVLDKISPIKSGMSSGKSSDDKSELFLGSPKSDA